MEAKIARLKSQLRREGAKFGPLTQQYRAVAFNPTKLKTQLPALDRKLHAISARGAQIATELHSYLAYKQKNTNVYEIQQFHMRKHACMSARLRAMRAGTNPGAIPDILKNVPTGPSFGS